MQKSFLMILLILSSFLYTNLTFAKLKVVAAENFYGAVAKELGDEFVQVVNILNNPSQDPHLFSTTPSIAKAMADADIIVYNGDDYDPWVTPMLNSETSSQIINVANLAKIPSGTNPHIWYSPNVMPIFAKKITELYIAKDPEHQKIFESKLQQFLTDYQKIFSKIASIKTRFHNINVIATEPVFNEMLESFGFTIHGKDFQMKMMNDIPPSISEIKEFETDLRNHRVQLFIFNDQVVNPMTTKMLEIAKEEKIPIVGVTELMPPNISYVDWILRELDQVEKALEGTL